MIPIKKTGAVARTEVVMPVFRDLKLIYHSTYHKSDLTVVHSMDLVPMSANTLCKSS